MNKYLLSLFVFILSANAFAAQVGAPNTVYRMGASSLRPGFGAVDVSQTGTSVTGVLSHTNGGTDLSTPGTAGNVLQSTGSGWTSASPSNQSYAMTNLGIGSATVASNALTIPIKQADGVTNCSSSLPCQIGFRGSSAGTGSYNQRSITGALSLTVPASATLGEASGATEYPWVYLLDDAGTVDICVSGRRVFDEGTLQSTNQISSSSTSGTILYCALSHSGAKPVRLVGRLTVSEATAGTWATAPSEVALVSFAELLRTPVVMFASASTPTFSPSLAASTWSTVINATVNSDTFGGYNASTGVYTVATGEAGYYNISCSTYLTGTYSSYGQTSLAILQNSTTIAQSSSGNSTGNGSTVSAAPISLNGFFLNVGDTIKCQVNPGSAWTSVNAYGGTGSSWLSVAKVGR